MRLIASLTHSGELSMLYSDCYHQYYPFFRAFREALLRGDSLLYSWDVGMGMDYLGLIAYYLASPLNLLSVLVPDGWTLGYFSLLMPLKLGFASLFFALFLKKISGRDDLSISLFGTFYALCAWALGYQWNIMWLDSFALLPLVVLGMLSLLNERKFILYTLSLFLAIAANYYIGFFICIFVLLSFICYEICRWHSFRKFLIDLALMAVFSLLAIGMTAVLSLPALAALQSTHSSVNKFPEGFHLNITSDDTWRGLLDAMRQVAGNMNGGIEVTYKEGLPNLYCGVGTNLLVFLFLVCRQVKLRDKVCSVLLLLFLNVSFIIRQLDYIWHGFHFTNMIPYRFSFLYSFVMLYMAYRAWMHRRQFRLWQVLLAGLLGLGLVFCSEEIRPFFALLSGEKQFLQWSGWENIQTNLETLSTCCSYLVYNLLFLIAYLTAFCYACPAVSPRSRSGRTAWLQKVRQDRQISRNILLSVMSAELILLLINFGILYSFTDISNYPNGREDAAAVIDYMHQAEEDTLFYRAETTHSQTLNDGALNGYHGVSTFTSSANVKVTEFMQALGFGAKNTYNRYCYEEASPVANLFLNLKYMIERAGNPQESAYFDDVYSAGKVHLLQNNAYLPLGFLTNAQILNVDFAGNQDPFLLQNQLFANATGLTEDCWQLLSGPHLMIRGSNLTLTAQNQTGYCTYDADKAGTVTYSYTADREGLFSFYINQTKRNRIAIYHNGEKLYSETYSLPQMLSTCTVLPEDTIEIELSCTAGETGTINVSAAILDEGVFRQGYSVLSAATLELTAFENTYVEGTILCNRDGVLYTSIPQDGNWNALVDGLPVQPVTIGGAMIGLNLSEGQHTVAFRYENRAFQLGWKVSLACLIVFLILLNFQYQPLKKPKKGKFER